jgi:hypothetical protein
VNTRSAKISYTPPDHEYDQTCNEDKPTTNRGTDFCSDIHTPKSETGAKESKNPPKSTGLVTATETDVDSRKINLCVASTIPIKLVNNKNGQFKKECLTCDISCTTECIVNEHLARSLNLPVQPTNIRTTILGDGETSVTITGETTIDTKYLENPIKVRAMVSNEVEGIFLGTTGMKKCGIDLDSGERELLLPNGVRVNYITKGTRKITEPPQAEPSPTREETPDKHITKNGQPSWEHEPLCPKAQPSLPQTAPAGHNPEEPRPEVNPRSEDPDQKVRIEKTRLEDRDQLAETSKPRSDSQGQGTKTGKPSPENQTQKAQNKAPKTGGPERGAESRRPQAETLDRFIKIKKSRARHQGRGAKSRKPEPDDINTKKARTESNSKSGPPPKRTGPESKKEPGPNIVQIPSEQESVPRPGPEPDSGPQPESGPKPETGAAPKRSETPGTQDQSQTAGPEPDPAIRSKLQHRPDQDDTYRGAAHPAVKR